jgi:hypothetical protein
VDTTPTTSADGSEAMLGSSNAFPPMTRSSWREGTLTRAREIRTMCEWVSQNSYGPNGQVRGAEALEAALDIHLRAAECAARERFKLTGNGSTIQRAAGNLDAAEADLLSLAPPNYVLDQMPSLLNHVQRHLGLSDARRIGIERIAQEVGVKDADHPLVMHSRSAPGDSVETKSERDRQLAIIRQQQGRIVAAVRGASSEALREKLRVASFRNALMAAGMVMTLLASGVAILGFADPSVIAMCFEPQSSGTTVVVCPTSRSEVVGDNSAPVQGNPTPKQIDATVRSTVRRRDLFVIETMGFTAASVAAAAAIRNLRGSSEPYGLPIALALLKMPTGAITALLGLLLMRGGFIPGLSALDTPAQIIAWAIVFGYAQQLFTRLLDQQANTVLGSVRGGDESRSSARKS